MNIIKQRQPRKAAGFQPIRQFAHKAKHRRSAHDVAEALGVTLSAWATTINRRIDVERVNWQGLIAEPQDMKPRLKARGER